MPLINSLMTDTGTGNGSAKSLSDQMAEFRRNNYDSYNSTHYETENYNTSDYRDNWSAGDMIYQQLNRTAVESGLGRLSQYGLFSPSTSAQMNGGLFDSLKGILNNAIGTGTDIIGKATEAVNALFPSTNSATSYGSGSGPGYGSSGVLASNSFGLGNSYLDQINQTVQSNNEWAAEQAQKQMDFQREMSSTAHQREIADLKAAGLNPVLSAGGSGASTPSGAMAQPDTTNSRAMLELALASMEAMSNTASAMSSAVRYSSGNNNGEQSLLQRFANSNFGRRFIGSAGSALGSAIIKALF